MCNGATSRCELPPDIGIDLVLVDLIEPRQRMRNAKLLKGGT